MRQKASKDIAAETITKLPKISVQDTERVIKDFAETTLLDLKTQSDATQMQLMEQIEGIQKFFARTEDESGETDAGDNIVTQKQFLTLEAKVDRLLFYKKSLRLI